MDKKAKALRRYKKSRQESSSDSSSSSSDSDSGSSSSYSSSASERRRHRHKKVRQPVPSGSRRSPSSSGDERRKRDKRDQCQKLEAKRNHLKRKLKEAKLKKKAAAAAAALSGHSSRALSPATQAKLKKLAERKHLRAVSKEEKREREKHRAALKEREREHRRGSRSPAKIRLHQDAKRQGSPPRMHHQLMSREKIIIQTRNRDRTPSEERERLRHEHKLRHDDLSRERDRREREAARDKERAEALARCQERQRERERIAREKLRREEEERYGAKPVPSGDRLLPARVAEREVLSRGYDSRERSMERIKREMDPYEHPYRKHRVEEYDDDRGHLDREELLREREYLARRRELSPNEYHGPSGSRGIVPMRSDPREMYPDEERPERLYKRSYIDEARGHPMDREEWLAEREREHCDYRESEHIYPDERERLHRDRERPFSTRNIAGSDWKRNEWNSPKERTEWDDNKVIGHLPSGRGIGFITGPKRPTSAAPTSKQPHPPPQQQPQQPQQPQSIKRPPSEPDWDAEEGQIDVPKKVDWHEHDKRDKIPSSGRPWVSSEWRDGDESTTAPPPYQRESHGPGPLLHHSIRGRGGFRGRGGYRPHHAPSLINLPVSGFHGALVPRFPKRNMTYTNPNLIKKQQAMMAAKAAAQASAVAAATTAVAAAKAAAHSAAATTNPGILGQITGAAKIQIKEEKPEAGEICNENEQKERDNMIRTNTAHESITAPNVAQATAKEKKNGGELSEISDSDDDILNKAEKKSKIMENDESNPAITNRMTKDIETAEDDEIMDFEEISDNELEEERAAKGVGDALGVDWSSLVAEIKSQPSNQTTTAKQKWQPHRIILDVGISMHMSGEQYAKELLIEAKQKLDAELQEEAAEQKPIKVEPNQEQTKIDIKIEKNSTDKPEEKEEDENRNNNSQDNKNPRKLLNDEYATTTDAFNVETLPALACMQVAQRKQQMERRQLISNACGPNSRALSARQDLKLRRQLCGLPARECDFVRNIPATSDKLKAMALAAFQRTLEVK